MTEMGSIVTMLTEEEHIKDNMRYLNSVGRPIEDHKVKIIADDGSECAPGETGEIVVTGPGMMKDYYKMPDETKEVMVDGWYHTRDMGYLDENGYLYISGRKSDMIYPAVKIIFPPGSRKCSADERRHCGSFVFLEFRMTTGVNLSRQL